MKTAHESLIEEVSTAYGIPLDILHAQVIKESSGFADAFRFEHAYYDAYIKHNPTAKAFRFGPLAACSYGLLQVLLETAMEEGFDGRPEDLFLPRIGLTWGVKHLLTLWEREGRTPEGLKIALARYNGRGPAAQAYADSIYALAGRVA